MILGKSMGSRSWRMTRLEPIAICCCATRYFGTEDKVRLL